MADDRAERLAAALRANLGRRKAQMRARRAGDGAAPSPPAAPPAGASSGGASAAVADEEIVPDGKAS